MSTLNIFDQESKSPAIRAKEALAIKKIQTAPDMPNTKKQEKENVQNNDSLALSVNYLNHISTRNKGLDLPIS